MYYLLYFIKCCPVTWPHESNLFKKKKKKEQLSDSYNGVLNLKVAAATEEIIHKAQTNPGATGPWELMRCPPALTRAWSLVFQVFLLYCIRIVLLLDFYLVVHFGSVLSLYQAHEGAKIFQNWKKHICNAHMFLKNITIPVCYSNDLFKMLWMFRGQLFWGMHSKP